MLCDFILESSQLLRKVLYLALLTNNLKELRSTQVLLHFLNHLIDAGREIIQIFKSFDGEVLRRRPVILHALKVTYDIFGAILLLIYYALEVIVLFVYLLHDFFLESYLASDPFLHPRAL